MTTEKAFGSGSTYPTLKPGTVRLYSMRFCPYAQRSRIALNHRNVTYEVVNINLKRKPEWFLKDINPLGLVPALQKDDRVVYESGIVCQYIDETFPGEKLYPTDPYQKALDAMLLERYSKVPAGFYKFFHGGQTAEDLSKLHEALAVVEQDLSKRGSTFFGGNKPMMVDFIIWPHIERILNYGKVLPHEVMTAEKFPTLMTWTNKIMEVPAVAKSMFNLETYKKVGAALSKGEEYYDIGLEE